MPAAVAFCAAFSLILAVVDSRGRLPVIYAEKKCNYQEKISPDAIHECKTGSKDSSGSFIQTSDFFSLSLSNVKLYIREVMESQE